MSTIYKNEDMH